MWLIHRAGLATLVYSILTQCSHYIEEWVANKHLACSPEPKTCSPESIFPVRCLPVSYPQFWISNSHASASEQWLQHASCRKNNSNYSAYGSSPRSITKTQV